ncbi:MAG: helix-turn-helix domain-containing protein [Thiohalocapsa sp.]
MPRPRFRTDLSPEERKTVQALVDAPSTAQGLARRARIVLLANGDGWSNQAIAEKLAIHKSDVSFWTKRWLERGSEPVVERLRDRPRSGRPPRIDADAWCRIMAMACEPPETYDRPISHWSSRELAEEVCTQGIVEHLSAGHLRKVLKKRHPAASQPLLAERQGRSAPRRAHRRHQPRLP